MKKLFLIILLFVSRSLCSQVLDESDKALKFSIILTKEYAKNYSKEFTREKGNYNKLISEISEVEPSEIEQFYDILESSGWPGAQKKIAKPVYENYLKILNNSKNVRVEDIDKYYTTFLIEDQLNYIDIDGNTEYDELISEYFVKDEIPKDSEVSISNNGKSKSESSGFFSLNVNILHVILVVIILFLLWLLKNNKSKSKNEPIRVVQQHKTCGECAYKNQKINSLQKNLTEINKAHQSLLEENKRLKNPKAIEDSDVQINSLPTCEPRNTTGKKILYFPGPSFAGTFRVDSASNTKKTNISIYRFELQSENSSTALVFFDPDLEMSFGRALNSPDKNILPICIEENAFNQQAKKIETIKPATARLNGDIWEIREEDKMRIRYV
jgi:hypothetical protein